MKDLKQPYKVTYGTWQLQRYNAYNIFISKITTILLENFFKNIKTVNLQLCSMWYLQCFDAVGWAAERASGLYKTEWWGAGVVVCLERGADLHMAQLMPLPLTVSCFTKIQIGFTFLVPAHLGSPGKRAVKRVCVCVRACVRACACVCVCVQYVGRTDAGELFGDEVRVLPDVSVDALGQQDGVQQCRVTTGLPQHLHQTWPQLHSGGTGVLRVRGKGRMVFAG